MRLIDEAEGCRTYEQFVSWDRGGIENGSITDEEIGEDAVGGNELKVAEHTEALSGVLAAGQCAKFGQIQSQIDDLVLAPRLAQFVANQGFVTATTVTAAAPASTSHIAIQVCNENQSGSVQLGGTFARVQIVTP